MSPALHGHLWRNWSGLEEAVPRHVETPRSVDDVVDVVCRAREAGTTVKMTGTGHSFTAIAAPEHTLLRPDGLRGIVTVDRQAMTVTALAGTPLKDLNLALERLGLSLHNMGDIAEQTLAGATSTGTHGTGGTAAGLAAQVAGLELVTGTGEVVRATATENADVLDLARVGLGALGILTTLTFHVEPLFVVEAHEQPMDWDGALSSYDEMVAAAHHVDMYWFPHTDRMLVKQNVRTDLDPGEQQPPSALAAWWEDELVSNTAFGALCRVGSRAPAVVPRINRFAGRALSERRYTDVAHRVFVSPRRVRFREMEYAVPREVGLDVLRECRRIVEASDWRIAFPVEVRTAPADDVALSTAHGRDTLYLAFHVPADTDHTAYFGGLEPVLREAGGRPHWGKVHTRTAADLAPAYDRFDDFLALRDRLDPDRVFANAHLRRVLGD
ncbi:D-arabinono-1,4-lactone oxidase [Nocardioides sp. zg-1228]|uniref:D-arabinono-1,4-lactone oxidase n=1 Tax=Nocardioides sp. zg-1228 TaxID=2763008 RepID=UPI001642EFB2|nr:D-arabinono-1,4-lactone oxidase [Nocardioides sp. zg-1228]MBC2934492.1 FAD-binding protein [Nocardioides sp. zg-1228]QSF59253.1 FAD-binding protein [Nocardioides sp. zg-1228]